MSRIKAQLKIYKITHISIYFIDKASEKKRNICNLNNFKKTMRFCSLYIAKIDNTFSYSPFLEETTKVDVSQSPNAPL